MTRGLRTEDVVRILGEERRRAKLIRAGAKPDEVTPDMLTDAPPLSAHTFRKYLKAARRLADGLPVEPQFARNPFPLPSNENRRSRGNYQPEWEPAGFQENRIRAWYRRRPGQGVGGGPKPGVVRGSRKGDQ